MYAPKQVLSNRETYFNVFTADATEEENKHTNWTKQNQSSNKISHRISEKVCCRWKPHIISFKMNKLMGFHVL